MKVVIIDCGAGNIFSVQQAFKRLGVETILSSDLEEIQSASHVVFPGVGHAKSAMENLKNTGLDKVIPALTQPVLGICLGMQLMCGWNEEGELDGLGIFETRIFDLELQLNNIVNSRISELANSENPEFGNFVLRDFAKWRRSPINADFQSTLSNYQFPHMGWNDVTVGESTQQFYFVHSFAAAICADTWGVAYYPQPFSASLRKNNFWGVQFHPEKSGEAGEQLLNEFLKQ